jgi:glycosyltransferase involved in cell wall biosynthesis
MAAEYIVKEMAPRVLGRLAEAYFLIIGRHDNRLSLLEDNRVIFTGEVSDLRPFLSAADICIVPLTLGSGVKLKLLTYLSFGKPIVSTPTGLEGINAKREVIVCGLQSFETEILKLASDRELRLKLGSMGRRLAEEVYDKHSVAKRLASVLSEVVS